MRWQFTLVGVCLWLLGCAGPPKHPGWRNATGAEQHERLMWQALRDKDWTNVERHLAPIFVGVDARGQSYDRAGWVAHWKAAPVKDFSQGEVSVQPEGVDMVVTYVLHLNRGEPANSLPAKGLRVISVWQQVKKRWILTATSQTPMVE